MDLFLRKAADRIGADDALTKVDALMRFAPIFSLSMAKATAPLEPPS
jgi:hypothetical protein